MAAGPADSTHELPTGEGVTLPWNTAKDLLNLESLFPSAQSFFWKF